MDVDTVTPRLIETVEELVNFIELTGLRAFEISGKRAEPEPEAERADEPASEVVAEGSSPEAQEGALTMQIKETHDLDSIETRFRATVEAKDADYVADFGLHYRFSEPLELAQPAIEGLLNRVAVMSAWPFIREAVATTAARMELAVPVMGLLRQGQFQVERVETSP